MFWNIVLLALRALYRNVLRSSLTMLGIVIGVAAVIVIVTLGAGASERVSAGVSSLGEGLLFLNPRMEGGGPGQNISRRMFTMKDAGAIERNISGVSGVSPTSSSQVTAVFGNKNWPVNVTGVTAEYFQVRNAKVIRGSLFGESQYRSGKLACIIGKTVREELFGSADPVGAVIRVGKNSCPVVGELESKGQTGFGNDQDNIILAPLQAVQSRLSGNQDISSISVSVDTWATTAAVREDITALLRERRNLNTGENDDFQVMDPAEIANVLADVTGVLTLFLGSIAAVSLLVGGIGIMNIMLVSVTERTREIGIRLAIGALEGEVLAQFLVEAIILTTVGGGIGILIGLTGSYFASRVLNFPFIIDPEVIAVAFAFSAIVGVIFGYMPARRAARLDPIDALRHE